MRERRPSRPAGFTLVEMLISLAVMMVIAAIGYPPLHNLIVRSKLEGAARETAMLMQLARLEAIKRSVPIVVRIDQASRRLITFADVNGAALTDPPDRLFNPVAGQPQHATDYELRPPLSPPGRIEFQAPLAGNVVEGFTVVGGDKVAIFQTDGSVLADGAIRFADGRGNFLEVAVTPKATARVELRKWDGAGGVNPKYPVGGAFRAAGEGGKPWIWY